MNTFWEFCEGCCEFFGVIVGTAIVLILAPTLLLIFVALLPVFVIIGAVCEAVKSIKGPKRNI